MAIFRSGGESIMAKATYDPPTVMPDANHYGNVAPAYSFVAQAVEVAVDTETGQVRVVRMVGADDLGKALNPLAVEGQLHGEMIQGLGFALSEEIVSEGGQVLNGNFSDYAIPKADHLPRVESIFVETIDPHGPYGAKGVSECSTLPPAPAIANAIYNAVGVRISSLPITPEKIVRALQAKQAAKA